MCIQIFALGMYIHFDVDVPWTSESRLLVMQKIEIDVWIKESCLNSFYIGQNNKQKGAARKTNCTEKNTQNKKVPKPKLNKRR